MGYKLVRGTLARDPKLELGDGYLDRERELLLRPATNFPDWLRPVVASLRQKLSMLNTDEPARHR